MLAAAVDAALPGTKISIRVESGVFELAVSQDGLGRPLRAAELSEGTLRYLLWVAALPSPRPPPLLVLNEPETSLNSQLLGSLARQIVDAGVTTQVIVVSHSRSLVDSMAAAAATSKVDNMAIELTKRDGETAISGQIYLSRPAWRWPKR